MIYEFIIYFAVGFLVAMIVLILARRHLRGRFETIFNARSRRELLSPQRSILTPVVLNGRRVETKERKQ